MVKTNLLSKSKRKERKLSGVVLVVILFWLPQNLSAEFMRAGSGAKEGISVSDEIELFIKGKISFFDNYSSDMLLLLTDRLFEQEFNDGKNSLYSARRREAGNYSVSFKKTIELLDEIIDKRGDDRFIDRFLYLRGYCYLEQGDHEQAFEDFVRIEKEFPSSPLFSEVSFRLAEYYFSSEQLALAMETYEKVLRDKESPYYDKALYKLGWAYYLTSNFSEAINYFLRLADQSYSLNKGYRAGMISGRGGQVELGSEDLSYEGLVYAALSYTNTGDAEDVLKRLGKKRTPYSNTLLKEVAHAYFDQSRYVDFVKVYDQFVTMFSEVPPALQVEKEIVSIRELDLSDKKEALIRKEIFVGKYSSDLSASEMVRFREKLDHHLRPMIRDLATYFHKEAVKTKKKETFVKAGGYYQKYLSLYKKAKDATVINLYFAESLFEYGDYLAAASEFEKVAPVDFGDLTLNEKAAYGAVAALENVLKELPAGAGREKGLLEKRLQVAERNYTDTFPKEKKSGPLYFRQGKRLFESKRYGEGISFFEKSGGLLTDNFERNTAYEYLADSYFNSRLFHQALAEYQKLLLRSRKEGDVDSEQKAKEYISRANINIAEELVDRGRVEQAARRYEKAAETFMENVDKERVLRKAMRLYISMRRWQEFERVYANFSLRYPDREGLRKMVLLSANTAKENFDSLTSGKYFERLSSLEDAPKKRLNMLLTAAREYEKGGGSRNAVRVFSVLYKSPAASEAQQLEFRFKAGEILEKEGNKKGAESLFKEVVALHREFTGGAGGDVRNGRGNRYFFGKASLRLLRKPFDDFVSSRLLQPFSVNFAKRLGSMGDMVKQFMEIAKLDVTEFSTQSLYKTGMLFESFRKSLIDSPPPKGLSEEEREEYSFMLEEKAFPYEERSVRAYKKSVAIGRKKGASDQYIDLCYERLSGISPAVYKRDEDIFLSKVLPLPPSFGFIGKIDLEIFDREKDEFSYEGDTKIKK